MWNDLEVLRRVYWWVSWLSIVAIFLGGVGLAGARLWIERRISSLATAREQERRNQEAQLRQELEESRLHVAELEQRQRPRVIDPDTAAKLTRALRASTTKVIVIGTVSDKEAATFGGQLRQVFEAAGWTIIRHHQFLDVFGTGLLIVVRDPSQPPMAALEVQKAFRSIGVELRVQRDEKIATDKHAVLFVGSKH